MSSKDKNRGTSRSTSNLALTKDQQPSYFKSLLSLLGGDSTGGQKKMEISGPINFTHDVHVGFNSRTGEFTVRI